MKKSSRDAQANHERYGQALSDAYSRMTPTEKRVYDAIGNIKFSVPGSKGVATFQVTYSIYNKKYHCNTYSDIGFALLEYETTARKILKERLQSYGISGWPISFYN